MPKYTVTENPPPFTQGLSTTSSINIELNKTQVGLRKISNNLIDIPVYNVVQRAPIQTAKTQVNSTVINQDITIINQGNSKVSAQYNHIGSIDNITTRTQIVINPAANSYDDNTTAMWSLLTSRILSTALKEFFEVTLILNCSTDTLGGAFELEIYNGTVLDIIENTINTQNQSFNTNFTIVTDQNSVTNGIQLYVTPELGMSLTINSFSLFIIKG